VQLAAADPQLHAAELARCRSCILHQRRSSQRNSTCFSGRCQNCYCHTAASAPQHCTLHDLAAVLQVRITPLTTKRVEHSGIKVQLLGQIELASERGSPHEFVSLGEPS
jgi:hypothetical protein